MHDIEDFMAHTYKSLFDQERKRIEASGKGGKKSKVALTFQQPSDLFTENDIFAGMMKCS